MNFTLQLRMQGEIKTRAGNAEQHRHSSQRTCIIAAQAHIEHQTERIGPQAACSRCDLQIEQSPELHCSLHQARNARVHVCGWLRRQGRQSLAPAPLILPAQAIGYR